MFSSMILMWFSSTNTAFSFSERTTASFQAGRPSFKRTTFCPEITISSEWRRPVFVKWANKRSASSSFILICKRFFLSCFSLITYLSIDCAHRSKASLFFSRNSMLMISVSSLIQKVRDEKLLVITLSQSHYCPKDSLEYCYIILTRAISPCLNLNLFCLCHRTLHSELLPLLIVPYDLPTLSTSKF